MHQTARGELKRLPAQATLGLYGDSTAAEILLYVERLLAEPAEQARGDALAENEPGAPLRSHEGSHG